MLILAIDTSCDDTSVAVCKNDRVLSNVVSSQAELHNEWGGVVPMLAKRIHVERIDPAIQLALKRACIQIEDIDFFAVTIGPGLALALEIGVAKAKELAEKYRKPLIAVNHMEGHIYSNFTRNREGNFFNGFSGKYKFPLLALLVSGNHTELVLMKEHGAYSLIGETLDDAAGEAFDKVARALLIAGYPGGPIVEQMARSGDPHKFMLPRPMLHSKDLNFSFSGLKTASFLMIQKLREQHIDDLLAKRTYRQSRASRSDVPNKKSFHKIIPDFCASFQEAVTETLAAKTRKAIMQYKPRQFVVGGGVISNLRIRAFLRSVARKARIEVYMAHRKLCGDNAAMIGVAAYYQAKRKEFVNNINQLDRLPGLRIDEEISL